MLQHKGTVDPRYFEMGVKKIQPTATFGNPYGMNSESPDMFLKSHSQEPILPSREFPYTVEYIYRYITTVTQLADQAIGRHCCHSEKTYTANACLERLSSMSCSP